MTDIKVVIEGLNDLLEKNYDAELGYQNARDNTEVPRLKTFFGSRSQQRFQYAGALKQIITKLGGTPVTEGSMVGKAHRVWIDFKSALAFTDEEAILEECERGEEASLKAYDEFFSTYKLNSEVAAEVLKQRNGIARSLKKVEMLEEQYD